MKTMRITAALAALAIGLGAAQPARAATLVADYKFNNPGNLGLDSSGLGNHAVNAGATPTADRFLVASMAGFFDGGDVMTKAGGLAGYDGLPGFTYAAWVNRSTADTDFGGIVSQDNGVNCCTNRLLLHPSDNPYVDAGAHADQHFSGITVPNSSWFHIVMTADDSVPGTEVRIYIDGALAGTHTFGHNLPNGSLFNTYIGAGEFGGAHRLIGSLDDVQVYDGVLTAAEARNVFAFGTAAPEPASLALLAMGAAMVGLRRRRA